MSTICISLKKNAHTLSSASAPQYNTPIPTPARMPPHYPSRPVISQSASNKYNKSLNAMTKETDKQPVILIANIICSQTARSIIEIAKGSPKSKGIGRMSRRFVIWRGRGFVYVCACIV